MVSGGAKEPLRGESPDPAGKGQFCGTSAGPLYSIDYIRGAFDILIVVHWVETEMQPFVVSTAAAAFVAEVSYKVEWRR